MGDVLVQPKIKRVLQQAILAWFVEQGRSLPWRETRDPYKILVSEVMLQQTQVARVKEKYPVFLKKYPNFSALAKASKAELIRDWEGMGYNNRILRLQRLAQSVKGKEFPQDPQALVKLDGIGPYTAHAVCCFAFEQDVPVVDVNIRRVFSRVLFPMEYVHAMKSEKEIWQLAQQLVPKGKGWHWNQALMDVGAMVCTAKKPACLRCPVQQHCASAFTLKPAVKQKGRLQEHAKIKKEIPNRIYRGRIVQYLRSHQDWVLAADVGASIGKDVLVHDQWYANVLTSLERDGMIEIKKGKKWKSALTYIGGIMPPMFGGGEGEPGVPAITSSMRKIIMATSEAD